MKAIHILILFFLVVPFIEIAVLLEVGSLIGTIPTIFLVVLTAVIGAQLLRQQGFATWLRFQENLKQGVIPAYEMIEGPILLVGGALLLTPGFFTDFIGFACLVPSLRRKIAKYVIENHLLAAETGNVFRQQASFKEGIIEGEYKKSEKPGD